MQVWLTVANKKKICKLVTPRTEQRWPESQYILDISQYTIYTSNFPISQNHLINARAGWQNQTS